MEAMLSQSQGILLFLAYSAFIIALVYFLRHKNKTDADDFLLMRRDLGVFRGSLSMAVSWIWAPAVFICSMQAFNQGLPGIFWFTVPNILCFFVFVPIALKLRQVMPKGYTISQIFRHRFKKTQKPHHAALIVTFGYQLGAIIINCIAGATLIGLLTGISYSTGVLLMVSVSLSYALISGLRASVISDVAQMIMILGIAFLIVPWVIFESGGLSSVTNNLGGVTGEYSNIFDPGVAYAFGIAMTIGLISGPVADQMFSQRAHAARKDAIKPIFIWGGILFGVVPITLSLLGFVGAEAMNAGYIVVSDPQMVGAQVVANYLPTWALMAFAVMAFAGLTSTLDSAFCAIASLVSADVAQNNKNLAKKDPVFIARAGMVIFAVLGVAIALLQPKLLWVFLIYGALAASMFIPVILALFWKGLTANGAFLGILTGITLGTPLSIYANINGVTDLIVLSAVIGLLAGGIVAFVVSKIENS